MKIAFYIASTGTLIDKLINVWTGFYGYSHCEIVFDHIEISDDDKWWACSAAPRDGEVRFKKIDIHSSHWELIDIPTVNTKDDELKVYNFLKEYEGSKYDWQGILLYFIFAFMKKQDNKKWWCSEICAYTLREFIDPKLSYRISPNKFAKKLNAPKQPFKFMFSLSKSF